MTFAVLQPSGNFKPKDMLTICDTGSANISTPSFSIPQGISSIPQAFSGSTLLNILNTSSLFVNWILKESDGIFSSTLE